jgi:hypothetical protein
MATSPGHFDEDEEPLDEDLSDSGDLPEMQCPSCGETVTEDTQQCPYCSNWIIPQDPARHGWRRWVFLAIILVMLYAVLKWTF